jgi:outer membrane murein-binding lipoprotein Lpp
MKRTNGWLLAAISACLLLTGCAGSATVRGAAIQLEQQVSEYERLIDDKIQSQNAFYQNQIALIEQSRQGAIAEGVEQFHRTRAAEMATKLSVSPAETARLANVTSYVIETTDAEYDLYERLFGNEQKLNAETEEMITKLQRQKDLLEGVKANLTQLSTAPKRRAQMLLSLSEDAFNQIKASK